jgi:general secretion pathway protein H
MPISALTRASSNRGFSLLELLVVLVLVGLVSAVVIPNIGNRQGGGLEEQARSLSAQIQRLGDRSLVRGQMLALRLSADGMEPLQFDVEAGQFVALEGGELQELTLPDDFVLEWQLDSADVEEAAVGEQLKQRLEAIAEARAGNRDSEATDDDQDDKDTFPQLFFFPSGEATPATLWLRDTRDTGDGPDQILLQLDVVGRVTRPQAPQGEAG